MTVTVRVEDFDRDARLEELGLSRSVLLEVVDACVAAEGDCTPNDPPMAKGLKVYFAGVRRLRELLCPAGWEKDDRGGFSTVINHERRIRLAFMNADDGTCVVGAQPTNRSRKGPNSERAATTNQVLLPGVEWPTIRVDGTRPADGAYATWHLCVHISQEVARAELTLQSEFTAGYFTDCRERIFLTTDGEWGDSAAPDDDLGPDIEVEVRRK